VPQTPEKGYPDPHAQLRRLSALLTQRLFRASLVRKVVSEKYSVTEQLHLSFDATVGRQISATLDLNDSMAPFLVAFSAISVIGLGLAAAEKMLS
jgi:hypothetical protein